MELKQIEYFCAVARLGSFTKAADECFVSQSAISQQIKALEADFECDLVARQGRSFTLTPAGECLARRGKELLDVAHALRGEVSDIALGRPGSLRVGYLNRYDGWELAGAVGTFARKHPSVEVEMQAGSHDAIYELMLAGKVDMVFNDKRRQFSNAFVNKHLMSCFDYVEVSEANELSTRDSLTAQDLSGQTCIVVCPRSQFETEQGYYRNVLNFDCAFTQVETLEQARFLVAANRGVLPLEARNSTLPSMKAFVRVPLVGPDAFGLSNEQVIHEYYAFWPRATQNPYCAEFAEILKGMFEG